MKKYHNFEEILKDVGSLGLYQWFVYLTMQYSNALQTVNQNFMAFGKIEPPWRCGEIESDENGNITLTFSNNSIPETMTCPNFTTCRLVEEKSEFYSLVQEWDLYCSLSYIPMFIVSIQMLGIIPGAFVFTYIIDNYGRKWSCHLLNVAVMILGLSSAFVDNWQIFIAIRFFIGFLFGGLFTVTVVIQMEVIKESDRMWIYTLDCWSVSNGLLALLAYMTGTWRMLIIIGNCTCIPLLFILFMIKESPRWLLQKGKVEEAANVLNHIAKWNGRKVRIQSGHLLNLVQFHRRRSSGTGKTESGNEKNEGKKRHTFLDIFHTKRSTINFLTLSYCWLATACMSYGLVYQSTAYSGSPFINYAVAASFRVITQILLFTADKYVKCRRRVLYLVSLGLVVCMLSVMAIVTISTDPKYDYTAGTVLRAVGLITSGLMSALWLIVYLLPIEIFPTVIRNIGTGGCSVMARIGAVLGPQLLYLQKFWSPTPFVGFTVVSVINFVVVFINLPETRGTTLPDSLDDPLKRADDPEEQEMLERDDRKDEK